jgi:hypothetical protein
LHIRIERYRSLPMKLFKTSLLHQGNNVATFGYAISEFAATCSQRYTFRRCEFADSLPLTELPRLPIANLAFAPLLLT